jgi:hypothetical protein
MGQQQLLLIVLGVIIVGIAIVVGINLFTANAIEANNNAVVSDLNNLAAMAISHAKKPASIGGGAGTFTGFVIPATLGTNANGTYTLPAVAAGAVSIEFTGTGVEAGVFKTTVTTAGVITTVKQ